MTDQEFLVHLMRHGWLNRKRMLYGDWLEPGTYTSPSLTGSTFPIATAESVTLESIEKTVQALRDAFPEPPVTEITLPREQYARLKALPILIDATLPDDTIRIGDSYLTGIKVVEE